MVVDKTLEMQTNENTVVFYKNKSEKKWNVFFNKIHQKHFTKNKIYLHIYLIKNM